MERETLLVDHSAYQVLFLLNCLRWLSLVNLLPAPVEVFLALRRIIQFSKSSKVGMIDSILNSKPLFRREG